MFEFRLQRVLELREQREQETATRLVAARNEAEAARTAQSALEEMRSASLAQLNNGTSMGTAVGELRNVSYMLDHLSRQIQEARSVAVAADETVRLLVEEFSVAFKERRVIDLLRSRQHDAWKAGEISQDRQAMDEIALARFTRQAAPHSGA